MAKIAIDVALFPPEGVMNKAVSLNQSNGPKFELNKSDRRPHITLSQAVINEGDLDEATSRLKDTAKNFRPLKLSAKIVSSPDSFFGVSPTEDILALHQAVMDKLEDLVALAKKFKMSFQERAKLAMERLSKQPPTTLEQMRAQALWLKTTQNSTKNRKRRR